MTCEISTVPVGILGTNCYLYREKPDTPCWIVDPGGDAHTILGKIEEYGTGIAGVLVTHVHFDHILALPYIADKFWDTYGVKLPIYVHSRGSSSLGKEGGQRIAQAMNTLSPGLGDTFSSSLARLPEATGRLLDESSETPISSIPDTTLITMYTPGHSQDAVCFYSEKQGILFSGDTLFYQSIGRTDFKGGSRRDITDSIRNRLYTLPDTVKVYPGHGNSTTIGYEKNNNQFITG